LQAGSGDVSSIAEAGGRRLHSKRRAKCRGVRIAVVRNRSGASTLGALGSPGARQSSRDELAPRNELSPASRAAVAAVAGTGPARWGCTGGGAPRGRRGERVDGGYRRAKARR